MAGRKGDGDGKHKALHGEPTHHTRERETKEESSSSSPRKQSSLLSASDQTSFTCSINKNLTITKHQDLKTIFFFFFSELTIKKSYYLSGSYMLESNGLVLLGYTSNFFVLFHLSCNLCMCVLLLML